MPVAASALVGLQTIRKGDFVLAAISTRATAITVGLMGRVVRIRNYDEGTGELVGPQIWIESEEIGLIGPLRREDFVDLTIVEGPMCSWDYMVAECGVDSLAEIAPLYGKGPNADPPR